MVHLQGCFQNSLYDHLDYCKHYLFYYVNYCLAVINHYQNYINSTKLNSFITSVISLSYSYYDKLHIFFGHNDSYFT